LNQLLQISKNREKKTTNPVSLSNFEFLWILVFILFFKITQGQNSSPKSYALIIGVSKYQDSKITSLKHAHKDAEAFADFCASPSGLNISADRLKIFTDEKASYWNILDGLDWLKNSAQREDQIYIYFAGHGDMESKELKYGYLLAHDSRYMNYLGRSLSLDLLNKTAHTLSVSKKAKVFIITDACHSGKLAGVDFNGSNLVALNLMQLISNNEVRITSCNEGELSYEDEVWGNGRGAFSYFLTKGMAGEADGENGKKDGMITIEEIKSFLTKNVPAAVKVKKKKNQNPVVMGSEKVILNSFIPTTKIINNTINEAALSENSQSDNSRSVSGSQDNALEMDILKSIDSKPDLDFVYLSTQPDTAIFYELLEKLREEGIYDEHILTSSKTRTLVAKILYNKVQHVLDLYLDGDEAELEKRRFYKQVDRPYEQYPYMVDIAIKLLPTDHILISSLKMIKEYLKGLAYRLQVPFTKDYKVLIDSAYVAQQKALTLDSTSAYIQNEIGILYLYKKNYDLAKYHFKKASIISPKWSLPYSNLANLYILTKDNTMAKKYLDKALDMQKNLQSPYLLKGDLYEQVDNLLFAEEKFQKAIQLNNRYYYPFEKLGALYLRTQDYVESNTYFYEANKRKLGLLAEPLPHLKNPTIRKKNLKTCDIDSSLVSTGDFMAHFVVGKAYFDKNNYEEAQKWFEKVVNNDVSNPLVYHYLGQTAYFFKSYDKAEFYFKRALDLYIIDTLFSKHVSETAQKSQYYMQFKDSCLYATYEKSHFLLYDTKLYLAKTYEKWKYFNRAIELYDECINSEPTYRVGFYMLWNMFKNKNDLIASENTIQRFGKYHPNLLDDALADFYKWVLSTYYEDLQKTEHYAYKFGLLMHTYMMKSPDRDWGESLSNDEKDFPNDFNTIITYPKNDEKERLVEEAIFTKLGEIEKPLSTGVAMFKKVISISVDKSINADAYLKIGDFYFRAKSDTKALENYEKSLHINDDDIGIRNKIIEFANRRYYFHKAFDQLTQLHESNLLGYDGTILLAKYYMKSGDRNQSSNLYDKISNTHPFLHEKVKRDVLTMYLRFEEYQKVIELINHYSKSAPSDMTMEYMLARSYAGLDKPKESLEHIKNAINLGFELAYVYKNDSIFDAYRKLNDDWVSIDQHMNSLLEDTD